MELLSNQDMWNIIKRTLNRVDHRLVQHGERVAYLAYRVLTAEAKLSDKEISNIILLFLLHDIGAYKTEEIDRMVEFETSAVWEHSVYGSLFLQLLSPISQLSEVILYHHANCTQLEKAPISEKNRNLAALLHIVDRVDLLLLHTIDVEKMLLQKVGVSFDEKWVTLLLNLEKEEHIFEKVSSNQFLPELERFIERIGFTEEEQCHYLRVIAYSIDFRSEFMVVHTVTTVSVCQAIGRLMNLSDRSLKQLYYGSLLHDIGKVSTPIEILEKPGKLTDEEMVIMRSHVEETGDILGGIINPAIYRIAVRHHEKMDGSGYPLGLKGEELTVEERICAVADIVSALIRKRSYKEEFSAEKTKQILKSMADSHQICSQVTDTVLSHYEEIISFAEEYGHEVLSAYHMLRKIYMQMMQQIQDGKFPSLPKHDTEIIQRIHYTVPAKKNPA